MNLGDLTLRELVVAHLTHFDLYSELRPRPKIAKPKPRRVVGDSYARRAGRIIGALRRRQQGPVVPLHEGVHGIAHVGFLQGVLPYAANGNPYTESLVGATQDIVEDAMWKNKAPSYARFKHAQNELVFRNRGAENIKYLLAHLLVPTKMRTTQHAPAAAAHILNAADYKLENLARAALKRNIKIECSLNGWFREIETDDIENIDGRGTFRATAGKKVYHLDNERPWENILPPSTEGFKLFNGVAEETRKQFYDKIAKPYAKKARTLRREFGLKGTSINSGFAYRLLDKKLSEFFPEDKLPCIGPDIQQAFQEANLRMLGYKMPTPEEKKAIRRKLRLSVKADMGRSNG